MSEMYKGKYQLSPEGIKGMFRCFNNTHTDLLQCKKAANDLPGAFTSASWSSQSDRCLMNPRMIIGISPHTRQGFS
ncbi:unnamed protein product, partial [Larinioides sclopetarius]